MLFCVSVELGINLDMQNWLAISINWFKDNRILSIMLKLCWGFPRSILCNANCSFFKYLWLDLEGFSNMRNIRCSLESELKLVTCPLHINQISEFNFDSFASICQFCCRFTRSDSLWIIDLVVRSLFNRFGSSRLSIKIDNIKTKFFIVLEWRQMRLV